MLVRFFSHNLTHVAPVECEMTEIPRREESVVLSFSMDAEPYSYRILRIRWYPFAEPPYVEMFVVPR